MAFAEAGGKVTDLIVKPMVFTAGRDLTENFGLVEATSGTMGASRRRASPCLLIIRSMMALCVRIVSLDFSVCLIDCKEKIPHTATYMFSTNL